MAFDLLFTLLGRDQLSDKLDKAGNAADRTADRFDGLGKIGTASMLGLSSAGGLAGAAIAAGLAAGPVALLALAAMSQSTNDQVVEAWSSTGSEIADGMQEATAPLADELVAMSGQVVGAFRRISPEIKKMAEEAGPGLLILTDGVIGLAENALPGLSRAVSESTPVMVGLNAALERTGTGASELLLGLAESAPSAGRNVGELGLVVEDLLDTGGRLVGMLSDNFQGTFAQTRVVVDQATDSVLGLAETGFPMLASSGGTVLGMVSSLLRLVGPLAPQLGAVAGVVLSMRAGASVFGAIGDAVGTFGGKLTDAAEKSGRTGGAVRGLGSALSTIGPYGAAAGAVLLGYSAAADAAFGSTDELATKILAGGNAAEQARHQMSENDKIFSAWIGTNQVANLVAETFTTTTGEVTAEVDRQRGSMTTLQRAQQDAAQAAADHSLIVERYGAVSDRGQASSALLAQAQDRLKAAQYDAAQATKSHTDRMLEQQAMSLGLAGANLNLRVSEQSLKDAHQQVVDVMKTHVATSTEVVTAKQGEEAAAQRVIEAAKTEALSHYANQQSQEAQTAATEAGNARLLEIAGTMNGPLPASLAIMLANMDAATLSVHGVERSVDSAGNAVYRFTNPATKSITLSANDLASAKINGARQAAENLNGNWYSFTVQANVVAPAAPVGSLDNIMGMTPNRRASGGPVLAGHTYLVGEEGPELWTAPDTGVIHPADDTARMLAGAASAGTAVAVAGRGGGDVHHWNVSFPNARDAGEIRRALLELKRDLGGAPLGIG